MNICYFYCRSGIYEKPFFIFQANNLYNVLSISVLRDYSRNVYVLKIIKRQKSERAFVSGQILLQETSFSDGQREGASVSL